MISLEKCDSTLLSPRKAGSCVNAAVGCGVVFVPRIFGVTSLVSLTVTSSLFAPLLVNLGHKQIDGKKASWFRRKCFRTVIVPGFLFFADPNNEVIEGAA